MMKRTAFAALFAACIAAPAAAQVTMKIGTATINDVQHEYAKRFAAEVEKRAGGKVKVEVYPAEQLGSNPRMIEGLSLGTVEGLIGPPELMVGVDTRFQIMGAPGPVTYLEHAPRRAGSPSGTMRPPSPPTRSSAARFSPSATRKASRASDS